MFMTKLKIGAALVVAAGIVTGVVGGSLTSLSLAQDAAVAQSKPAPAAPAPKTESDEEFIRRISKDLRGIEPSSTEVHFFAANKDANRRQKLIDLFIQERQAKERAAAPKKEANRAVTTFYADDLTHALSVQFGNVVTTQPLHAYKRRLATLQGELYKELYAAAKDKKDAAAITQKYLEQLQEYVKAHPKNEDVAEAMQQIALIYRSQGKTVEADAWRAKLLKEHPQSPAAKAAQQTSSAAPQSWNEYFNYPFPYPIEVIYPVPARDSLPWNTELRQYLNTVQPVDPSLWQPYLNQRLQQPAPKKDDDKEKRK